VGYLVGSARVVSQKHPLFDPAISGHSRHVCKTPSLGESAVRLRLSDPSLKRRWRVKLRSSAGLRRLQYLNPPMNALCYRLPIAHSPAGDTLTTAAAVQGLSGRGQRGPAVQINRSIASKILLCSNLEFFRSN
jgi:hypothetical protein